MTTFAWPTNDSAFWLKGMSWGVLTNSRSNTSELNGSTQGISLPGARRLLTLEVPEQTYAERARLAAFVERMNGPEHRLSIWDMARPTTPALAGSPTVSGAVSQFAETLNIASGGLAGVNLLRKTQQLDDAVWVKSQATISPSLANDPFGGVLTADAVRESAAASVIHAVRGPLANFDPTKAAAFSLYARGVQRTRIKLMLFDGPTTSYISASFDLTAGSLIASSVVGSAVQTSGPSITDAGGGWWRCSIAGIAGAAGASAQGQFRMLDSAAADNYTGDGTSALYVWGVQLEQAAAASPYSGLPALNAGDWIGVVTSTGNQLVKVVNDVVANASDLLSGVEIRHALRGSVANGSAVTIVQPTALYTLRNPDQVLMPRGGRNRCAETSIELVEAFS